ncbi:uncharacterized protein BJ171DRAFT_394502, partial [Polychytrium aggregatum]|uniref:uncharacterized protein n=1 Tax=Polychytrium aggregatum TaxID=110093 RepID=UPI0022FE3F66
TVATETATTSTTTTTTDAVPESKPVSSFVPENVDALPVSERKTLAESAKGAGNKLFIEKNYTEAIDLYSQAIALHPTAIYYSNRAACYSNLGKFEKVVEDSTESIKLDPVYIKAINRRAQAYEKLDDLRSALKDYTTLCVLEEFKSEASLNSMDRVMKRLGKDQAAEIMKTRKFQLPSETFITAYMDSFRQTSAHAQRIIDLTPVEEGDRLVQSSFRLILERKYTEASEAAFKACDSPLSDAFKYHAFNIRGTFSFLKGDVNAAFADFEEAIKLNPNDIDSLIKRASIFMERGDIASTLQELDSAEKINSQESDLYYHRGQVRFLTEQFAPAVEDYKKSIALDSNFVYAHIQLGVTLYKMGSVMEAMAVFRKATNKFENSFEVYNYHGEILLDQGNFTDALANFKKASSMQPNSPLPYINQAILHLSSTQDIAEAEALCRKAIEVDPLCDIAYAQLAQLLLQQKKTTEALQIYDTAISITRSEPELINAIACREAAVAHIYVSEVRP